MKLKFRISPMLCGLMAFMIFAVSTEAKAQAAKPVVGANREWIRTAVQDQINQGKLPAAIALLNDHLKEDDKDAESWARLALLQSRLLKCDEAQASLSRAAAVGSAAMQDAYRTAAAHLQSKGCKAEVSDLSLVAGENRESARTSEWGGSAKLKVGHDSNVILLSDSVSNSTSPSSNFLNPMGQVDYRRKFERGVLEARSLTSYTGYTSKDVDQFNSIYQSLSADWEPSAVDSQLWDKQFGNRLDASFVNSDGMRFFSWVDTLYARFSRPLTETTRMGFEVPVGYQKFADDTAPTSADKRDGVVVSPSVWYARRFEAFVWNASLAYSQVMASGENYRSRSPSIATGLAGGLSAEWRARANLSFTQTDYFESALDRKDDRLDAGLGVVYSPVSKSNLSLALDVFTTDNKSNLNGATYKRNTVMGQVDYAF